MFIVDKFFKSIVRRTDYTDKAIKAIRVKEDIREEKYLYVVEKVGISIFILFVVLIISFLININEKKQKGEIRRVSRDNQYNLMIEKDDGETTKIILDVPERVLSETEKEAILDRAETELLTEILGKNESLNNVCYRLNLINNIGEHGVVISWHIENSSVVDYEGYIGENIDKEGQLIKLEATLMLDKSTRKVVFSVNVFPSKDKKEIGEYLQEYVEEKDISENDIELPQTFEKKSIKYYTSVDNISTIIIVVGIILAFSIYFLKDKDLEKNLKERNKQLIKDYPEIVSKILLFYGAGLSIKMTFEEIVKEYEKEKKRNKDFFRYAYEEMNITLNKMRTGIPERNAIVDFGKRCGPHCYIRLANIIEQNLKRGTKEITYALKAELNEAINERKNRGLKIGNEISTKMLGPMLIMLMVAIVIVIVPAFLSMNF